MSQATKQVKVVTADAVPGQDFEPTAFFDADGAPIDVGGGDYATTADLAALTARVEALEAE